MKSLAFRLSMLIVTSANTLASDAQPQPNIVLFVADDMGWSDVGYHNGLAETPNIDQLVADGVRLDRFYVHPVCSPTRTAMMTGRSPVRFGITGPLLLNGGVPLDEHFMPESFQAAGYQTCLIGKWHLGAVGEEYSPLNRGFHHFYGHRNGSIDYFQHTNRGKPDWQRNGQQILEEGYSTDLFANEAVQWIEERSPGKPMFLFLSFNAPHGPAQAPDDFLAKYREVSGNRKTVAKLAAIDAMDQAIGRVLEALEKEGIGEETLVMFFCDNGGKVKPGEQPVGSAPSLLRGGKSDLFEGGIRVPAVIRWPGKIQPGSCCEAFISIADLFPTLATATGVAIDAENPLDGKDMWASISEGKKSANPFVISGEEGAFAAFRDPLKLIRSSDGEEQLFDVRDDPSESRNLSNERTVEMNRLRDLMAPFLEFDAN